MGCFLFFLRGCNGHISVRNCDLHDIIFFPLASSRLKKLTVAYFLQHEIWLQQKWLQHSKKWHSSGIFIKLNVKCQFPIILS